MFKTVAKLIKWIWLPVLLATSILTRFTAGYEALVDCAVSLAALFLIYRAVRLAEYYWAAGFLATVFVFSPFFLADKIFLLLDLACITTLVTLFVAYRTRPALDLA